MSETTQSGRNRGKPERRVSWDELDALLDETCRRLGYGTDGGGLDRTAGDKLLSLRLGMGDHGLWRWRTRRASGPDWDTCWRLAEVSKIDLLRWYEVCGFLPEGLTTYSRPSRAEELRSDIDSLRTLIQQDLDIAEEDLPDLLRSFAQYERARGRWHTAPSAKQPRDRAGHR